MLVCESARQKLEVLGVIVDAALKIDALSRDLGISGYAGLLSFSLSFAIDCHCQSRPKHTINRKGRAALGSLAMDFGYCLRVRA